MNNQLFCNNCFEIKYLILAYLTPNGTLKSREKAAANRLNSQMMGCQAVLAGAIHHQKFYLTSPSSSYLVF